MQIRDFIRKFFFKSDTTIGNEILDIFQKAYNDGTYQKIISRSYSALQNLKGDHTLDIKTRWEAEGNIIIRVIRRVGQNLQTAAVDNKLPFLEGILLEELVSILLYPSTEN